MQRPSSALPAAGGRTGLHKGAEDGSGRRQRPASSLWIIQQRDTKLGTSKTVPRPSSAQGFSKPARPGSALDAHDEAFGSKNQEPKLLFHGSMRSKGVLASSGSGRPGFDNLRALGKNRPLSAMSRVQSATPDDEQNGDQASSRRPLSAMTWAQPRPSSSVNSFNPLASAIHLLA